MKVSIIIPFYNEQNNVVPVLNDLRTEYPDAEILAVNDASSDHTLDALLAYPRVRVFSFSRRLGQSAALYKGLAAATGDVCVIIDGDGQSSTTDIKSLLEKFPEYDFATGCRTQRNDSASRVIASRLANAIRNLFTRDGWKDTGGTPKAMKRACVAHLIPFDAMHRFIPALLVHSGLRGIEVPVSHHDRLHGTTKYTNWGRALRGAWDLIGVRWLLSRRIDPGVLGVAPSLHGRNSGELE